MSISEETVQKAHRWLQLLRDAERDRDNLEGFQVVGIMIVKEGGLSSDPITLTKGTHGTGSITSIGYPDELALQMKEGLQAWANRRVNAAKEELAKLGVDHD